MLTLLNRPQQGLRPMSETVFAALLAGAALYILFNEGAENWQSLWSCALYLTLALTLWQARAAQIPE
jgi:glucan 1,3-beta-glucosidase